MYTCLECKKRFQPNTNGQKYCGSFITKTGCSYVVRNRKKRIYNLKSYHKNYLKNRDKVLARGKLIRTAEYNKSRYQKDKFKLQKYREENIQYLNDYFREYYQRNKVKRNLQAREWAKKNHEKRKYMSKMESHRRRQAKGNHTFEEWIELLKIFDNQCVGCNRKDLKLTIDHKIPLARGGTNWIDNIQPLCMPCNHAKFTKTMFPVSDLKTRRLKLSQPSY